LLLSVGLALTTYATSQTGLLLTLGVLSAAGAGAGSFSILIGGTARTLSPKQRSLAAGVINAGGSLGQFVFAPITQAIIAAASWGTAMFTLAATALLTIPLAWPLRSRPAPPASPTVEAKPPITLREQLRIALRDPSFLFLNLGFFTCGFHVAFLVTHFPGEIQNCGLTAGVAANSLALIGLFNVGGSLAAGYLGQRMRMKSLLAGIYGTRAALIAIYLLMPKTALNVYLFAAGLGLTWLATVPPTSGIVGKLFGVRYLGTLFGLTLVSHQTGAFLGAWLGGIAMSQLGSYQWVWYADMALALGAAVANLPIREEKPLPRAAVAA
jgi:predicted MFS family arabinose efflux permease